MSTLKVIASHCNPSPLEVYMFAHLLSWFFPGSCSKNRKTSGSHLVDHPTNRKQAFSPQLFQRMNPTKIPLIAGDCSPTDDPPIIKTNVDPQLSKKQKRFGRVLRRLGDWIHGHITTEAYVLRNSGRVFFLREIIIPCSGRTIQVSEYDDLPRIIIIDRPVLTCPCRSRKGPQPKRNLVGGFNLPL